ncbi:PTS sugar transporter subunit IIA [Lacticaseibacillus thailandensis]|uniref:PTS family mannose fructose sorbose porter component IIA n=1 Tax=Lacticaseibacillus thailandensis DSM 22698 = JCM 13996 TaxID=1423810 RepID=A0A0R2C5X0_9LACO|nr:PTS fructose transporter subunit IIA [Lacticaseibacillus thailandensis]KRM87054.1 PTS family mannose fructose sorbose porter component IIA [Lacticaseibacillus thailandensis DSM 22698 = JCM 13996]
MTKLILISHGSFCVELKKSAELIMGPQDDILTVPLLPNEGPEDFQKKFKDTIAGLDDFTVLADLMGGTPANVVSRMIMEGADIDLYAGMNLPMVISFINGAMVGTTPQLVDDGKAGVVHINDVIAGTTGN